MREKRSEIGLGKWCDLIKSLNLWKTISKEKSFTKLFLVLILLLPILKCHYQDIAPEINFETVCLEVILVLEDASVRHDVSKSSSRKSVHGPSLHT
jgi:hypothetical protein